MLKHVSLVRTFWFVRYVLITVFSMPRPEENESSPNRLHTMSNVQCQIKSHCSPSNTTNMFSAFFSLTPNFFGSLWFITGVA
jgi:membrane-anchored protein YejM (alkaline phosphatase superfamily)